MSDFLKILKERGFVHQLTDEEGLQERLKKGPCVMYGGFDATADSLHVGNLMLIMMLHWAQKCGHIPYVLVGGGTTKIGDPSGKEEARKLLTPEKIDTNIKSIRSVFSRFIDFNTAKLVNNDDWLKDINYIDFLRDIGRHFSINRMLTFDSVRLRLERQQSLTFLEFNYMILQAYDYMHLAKEHHCCVQLGGSDQWGNIVNGIELTRRMLNKEVYGLTCPLITTSDGKKMGKSVNGAVWLNAQNLDPFDYWQFWRNTNDADVGRFLKLYTTLSLDEIASLESLEGSAINHAKIRLADEATALLHGTDYLEGIHKRVQSAFGPKDAHDLSSLPVLEVERDTLVVDALLKAQFVQSKGEARRLIEGRGVRVDEVVVESIDAQLTSKNMLQKLSSGKKKHIALKVE